MLGQRELTGDDYLAIWRRKKWLILIPAVLGPALAFGVSLLLPEKYVSTTLVLVEQQRVPQDFVRSVVTDELNERLATMREQILSRTRLQPIIEKFGLFKAEGNLSVEDKVARLRTSIEVTPIKPIVKTRGDELPGFFISFSAGDARTAQQVCAEITSLFMEENLKSREQRAIGTTEFLGKQLDDAKKKLDEQDQRLAAFKQRHIGQLPGQEQTNMNLLMGLHTQLEAATQAMSRAQQDKAYLESLLNQQVTAWEASRTGSNPVTLEKQLERMEADLVSLEARYTSDHPDVIKARNDIAQFKKRIEEARTTGGASKSETANVAAASEPAEIQQMRSQIRRLESILKDKTVDQERIQREIRVYQARVQLSPVVEQQYKELTRDHETALNSYNDLLKKKTQSEIATDLERRQQGEQFRVVDPANLPERPSFPDRPKFALGGLAGGLALGLGLALLLEWKDKSIRNERDVEALLGLPTLALVPLVELPGNPKRKLRLGSHMAPAAGGD